jgi:hypothetical protein
LDLEKVSRVSGFVKYLVFGKLKLIKKLAVFRACIPESYKELRGLTEMLVGMGENEMNEIIPSLN